MMGHFWSKGKVVLFAWDVSMMHMVGGNSLLCHVDAFIKLGNTVTMYKNGFILKSTLAV